MSRPIPKDPDTSLGLKVPRKVSGELVWKLGVFLLLIGNLFIKTQYVSQADYKADRDADSATRKTMETAIIELKTLVAVMETKNEVNRDQDADLQDHENRIRALENGIKKR